LMYRHNARPLPQRSRRFHGFPQIVLSLFQPVMLTAPLSYEAYAAARDASQSAPSFSLCASTLVQGQNRSLAPYELLTNVYRGLPTLYPMSSAPGLKPSGARGPAGPAPGAR